MSLLMQALKKAERAKDDQTTGAEASAPALAVDDLTLAPLEEPPSEEAPPPRRERQAPPPPMAKPAARPMAMPAPDPRTMRVLAVLGALVLLAGVFAYLYWRAMYGPGSSRNLPMVPMPGQETAAVGAPAAAAPPSSVIAYAADVRPPSAPPPSQVMQLTPEDYQRMDSGQPGMPAPMAAAPASAAPVPAAPIAAAAPAMAAPEPVRARAIEAAPVPAAPRAASPPPRTAADNPIRVARAKAPLVVPLPLQQAYAAYQSGDMAGARRQYQAVLAQDPNNRDAILGDAAIALQERDTQRAAGDYLRLLEADPNDSDALAGLAGLPQAQVGQLEARLRRALDREPDAGPVLFALGNLYAREGRWAEAQQQYFRAVGSAPGNASYVFNLAVGLDRMNQKRLARDYYQRALALADQGAVQFDRNAAAARLRELGAE
jgi:Tfp pilus assembly protein PilF